MDVERNIQIQIERALEEDRFHEDVTARLLEREGNEPCQGIIKAKEVGVFFGEPICVAFFHALQGTVSIKSKISDGDVVSVGQELVDLQGKRADCLAVERTLLNFLSHLSGVATLTRRYVDAVSPFSVRILATRKTLPGLRELQLQAVSAGGGFTHRRSLSDGILIKENHQLGMNAKELILRAKKTRSPLHGIEVEVQDLSLLEEVLENPPDVIMLDNLCPEDVRKAIQIIDGKAEIEVSGGIHLENVRSYAELGVQYISVGSLTHSARSLDFSMDFILEENV